MLICSLNFVLPRFSFGGRLIASPASSCKRAHLLGTFRVLEQPLQKRGSLRSIYLTVRRLSRAARFSGDFVVLPPSACPAHVANVVKQLGVPITEARRAVRTGRVLACLAGTSSIQFIARQQFGVVRFIVFSSAASESAIGGLSAAQYREVSVTASSAEMHNVLDPNGTSEDMAGRRG